MTLALEGLRILDLTRVLAGPYATMILADLGAEVIKLEMPGTGDDSRAFPPHVNGESAYFMSLNRNKRSIAINLKRRRGRDIFRRLAADADVVLEGFRPGVTQRLGIDYDHLREINPRPRPCASRPDTVSGIDSATPALPPLSPAVCSTAKASPNRSSTCCGNSRASTWCCTTVPRSVLCSTMPASAIS